MKQTRGNITFWEQRAGKRVTEQILRWQCVKGDSDFIATGDKPKCPECGSRRLRPVVEIEQLGLFSSKFFTVMRCMDKECKVHIVFEYEIAYDAGIDEE